MDDNLRYKTIQYNPFSIVRQISHHRLVVYPNFKDRKPWTAARRSRYIESIMLGIPSQPIWCEESPTGNHLVIDGSQRIEALNDFLNGSMILTGLRVRREYNGLRLRDLPYHEVANIEDRHSIPFIIVNYDAQPELKCEFYWRLFESERRYKSQSARNFGFRDALPYLKRLQYESESIIDFHTSKFRSSHKESTSSKIDEFFLYLVLFTSAPQYSFYVPDAFSVEDLLDSLMERLAINDRNTDSESERWASEIIKKLHGIAQLSGGQIKIGLAKTLERDSEYLEINDFYETFLRFPRRRLARLGRSHGDVAFNPTSTADRFFSAISSLVK